jgi:hypothetical protein
MSDGNNYWEDQADRLPRREIDCFCAGNDAEAYRLIQRLMEMNEWHGEGPPACTEEPCPEEDHFVEVELPRAVKDLLKDMAAFFGMKITGFENLKKPHEK